MIATPSLVSLASVAGHMSLLFRLKNDPDNRSPVISFMADSVDKNGALQQGFPYVFNGIFGKYRRTVEEESLKELVYRHNVIEGRDIFRLILKLNKDQIGRLICQIEKIRSASSERYYFFNKNCTSFMVDLLNAVLPEDDHIPDRESIDMPLVVGSYLVRNGLAVLEETGYRWFSENPSLLPVMNRESWRTRSVRNGYSMLMVRPSFRLSESASTPTLSVKLSTYHQDMGDKSVFSLGPETELDLFSLEGLWHLSRPDRRYGRMEWDMNIRMIHFGRLIVPRSRKKITLFNPGLKIELLSLSTDHQRGIQSDFSPVHLTYYLNLIEVRNLSHLLNLGMGWGLSQRTHEIAGIGEKTLNFMDFSASLHGKIQLPGSSENTLRLESDYRARWAQNLGLLSEWQTRLEVQWQFRSNHSILMRAGLRYSFCRYHFNDISLSGYPENRLSAYLAFCHFGNIFPTLGDLKSLLGNIFR